MRTITYKYKVGDLVKFKDHYDSSASCDLFDLAGLTAKVVDCADFGGPAYKLKLEGYEDTWFKQGCFAGLATVSVDTPEGSIECQVVTI